MKIVRRLASMVFVTALIIALFVGMTPTVMVDQNNNEGSYDILVLRDGNWQLQGKLSFSDYETLQLPLSNDAGQVRLRITQHGHDGAFVDYLALRKDFATYIPVAAVNTSNNANVLTKVLSPEYDVCDAWDSTLEIAWDNVPEDTTLVMRAMEEDLVEGHGNPLYYPDIHFGQTLEYTLVNDVGIIVDGVLEETAEPDFTVFWQPDSPHPDGYTYGWLHCDEDYLYAAVEVTADNTPDEEDWGALYVMVNGELKEFRISYDDSTWGTNGFQYITSAVPYEHRIYEFQIPLSEINGHIGDEIEYGFGCYGTVAVFWPATWIPLDADGAGAPDCPGGTSYRDVVSSFYNTNDNYLYLRLCTSSDAGWPDDGPPVEEARYKWWFDQHDQLYVAGTLVHHAEHLLILEDLTINANEPTLGRDHLGELTLMDDLDLVGYQTRWDNGPAYLTSTPSSGTPSPSPHWRRVLGTGTPGDGGPQGSITDPDIGYEIGYDDGADCNYVNMYVSWDALLHGHESDSLCVIWATDLQGPNLDQAPNCDRPEEPICSIPIPHPDIDFGDAPDPTYPTLLANAGARHIIDSIYMGSSLPDAETDGQPNATATGDDTDGNDDEDGVVFLGDNTSPGTYSMPYQAGETGGVRITVGGAVSVQSPAYLHGWFDWNQDGDWVDPLENVFSSYAVTAPGTYTIDFLVPLVGTLSGTTFARFRIDDENLNSFIGLAENGEVEDYEDIAVSAPDPVISLSKDWELINDVNNNSLPDPGDTVRYTINYSNPGDADLTGVYIEDDYDETLLTNITNITDDANFTSHNDDGTMITWPNAGTITLSPSDSGSLSFEATLNPVFPAGLTQLQNTATIYANDLEPLSDCACFQVNAAPVLTIDKSFVDLNGGSVKPGDTIEYSISYANNGNADASHVFILDDYSEYCAGISDITDDANFTSHDDDGDIIIWPATGSIVLPAGESGTLSYRCTLAASFPTGTTRVENTAVIFSNETGPIDDTETIPVRVRGEGPAVGGIVYPTNKLAILMPWIMVATGVALGFAWLRRRHARR